MTKKISILAVLVLTVILSTGSVAGTYAKYTSSNDFTDQARVAKWGFSFGGDTAVAMDLFKDSYDGTVTSDNTDRVIAPGTAYQYTFKLTNETTGKVTPEVKYSIKFVDNSEIDSKLDGKLVFSLDGTTYKSLTDVIAELNTKYTAVDADTEFTNETLYWKWAFDGDDETDTALGNDTTLAWAKINLTITAEQID
ncbi:MAG: hypothetical protein HFJ17_03380 [Clostridia bacterium]|nr:hypothetical protein [Clostridia bacterium]